MAPPQSCENGVSDTATTPAAKRRRTALACTACRLRKSRCDGRRPSCSSCVSLHFDCQYEPGESAANVIVRKEYMSDLDQRVSTVEQVVQRLNYVLEGHLTACAGDVQYRPSNPFPVMPPVGENLTGRAAGLEEPQDEDATVNGMAMTFIEERTSAFFGGSSNINFIRQLLSAVNHIRYAARRELSTAGGSGSNELDESNMVKASRYYANPVAASPDTSRNSMTALPSAQEMEVMLDVYFSTAGVVFPFIDEESFRKTYANGKATGFTIVRRTWLGSLNMIFAMACHFDRGSIKSRRLRKEKSDVFFKRATDLCGDLSKQVISLEIVHYLLLYVIHCQGSQRSVQAWNIHGLLVRSAMALGLHSSSTRDAGDDQQAEYRRRTWLVIYCIDKVLSVAFGRPVSIPDEMIIDRPPMTGLALPSPDGSRYGGDIPGEFLNVSFRLYQVMSGCLKKQYSGNMDSADQELDDMATLQASGEFRKVLRTWSSSLPSFLRLAEPNADFLLENTQVNRLRVILTLRYHNINILVHRPLLGSTIRHLFGGNPLNVGNPSYLIQLAMGEAHECIRSAQSTIEIVYNIINGDQSAANNLGMEYFTLYYVFTASLVILGRILWAQHGQNVIDETALSACKALLGQVQVILPKLDQDNSLVDSCSRYLHNMLEVCTSEDATIAAQNGSVDGSSAVDPRFDHQPNSASAPNPLDTMMDLGVGDLEMFQLYSYNPGIFDGWDMYLADSTTARNTQLRVSSK